MAFVEKKNSPWQFSSSQLKIKILVLATVFELYFFLSITAVYCLATRGDSGTWIMHRNLHSSLSMKGIVTLFSLVHLLSQVFAHVGRVQDDQSGGRCLPHLGGGHLQHLGKNNLRLIAYSSE
jgi:hypothetical protein